VKRPARRRCVVICGRGPEIGVDGPGTPKSRKSGSTAYPPAETRTPTGKHHGAGARARALTKVAVTVGAWFRLEMRPNVGVAAWPKVPELASMLMAETEADVLVDKCCRSRYRGLTSRTDSLDRDRPSAAVSSTRSPVCPRMCKLICPAAGRTSGKEWFAEEGVGLVVDSVETSAAPRNHRYEGRAALRARWSERNDAVRAPSRSVPRKLR